MLNSLELFQPPCLIPSGCIVGQDNLWPFNSTHSSNCELGGQMCVVYGSRADNEPKWGCAFFRGGMLPFLGVIDHEFISHFFSQIF